MDAWLIHGLLGCFALLLIFPLGIIKLWSKSNRWAIPHWMIQSNGLLALMCTTALGLLKSSSLHSSHQWLGLGVSTVVLIQVILGHANAQKGHWTAVYIAIAHSSLGLGTLLLGWITILTGFRLASIASTPFIMVGLLSATEISALIAGSLILRRHAQHTVDPAGNTFVPVGGSYALAEDERDDEQSDEPYEDKSSPSRLSTSTTVGPYAV